MRYGERGSEYVNVLEIETHWGDLVMTCYLCLSTHLLRTTDAFPPGTVRLPAHEVLGSCRAQDRAPWPQAWAQK